MHFINAFYLFSMQVEEQLRLYGAQEEKYLSSFISHVICDDPGNSDYLEAKDVFDLIIIKVCIFRF